MPELTGVQISTLKAVRLAVSFTPWQREAVPSLLDAGLIERQTINGHVTPWLTLTDDGRNLVEDIVDVERESGRLISHLHYGKEDE